MSSPVLSIGGLPVRNTRNLLNKDTKLCGLVYGPSKYGKTRFAAGLNQVCLKHHGKPALFIACEDAEGGGTMSIRDLEVPFVEVSSWEDLQKILAGLQTDKQFAGVVADNLTDIVKKFVKPYALKQPYTKGTPPSTRMLGVPAQGDYETMGAVTDELVRRLIYLTKHPDPACRKHFLAVALEKWKTDRDGNLIRVQPDLPGAMAEASSGKFQLVAAVERKAKVTQQGGKSVRSIEFSLVTEGDGVKILGDRYGCFPKEGPASLEKLWEEYWMVAVEKASQQEAA